MRNLGEISVIIPFYNAQKYIPRCIASLLNQTYPYFKVYFIDDGSTDRSVQLLREYNDPRFTILRQREKGISAARNLGLKNSREEYIAFMDIDDELRLDYLEKLITAADQYQIDIVLCNYYKQYADGSRVAVLLPWADTTINSDEIRGKLIPWMIADNQGSVAIWGTVWRTFMRRTFWEKTNLWFHVDMPIREDLLFTLVLYNRTEAIYILKDCLYAYYQNVDSTLHQIEGFPVIRKQSRSFHKILRDVLEEEGLLQENQDRYWAHWFSDYTVTIYKMFRQKANLTEIYGALKELRQELLRDSVRPSQCVYLPKKRKLVLWMLKYRMYIPLLALYWIKEKARGELH